METAVFYFLNNGTTITRNVKCLYTCTLCVHSKDTEETAHSVAINADFMTWNLRDGCAVLIRFQCSKCHRVPVTIVFGFWKSLSIILNAVLEKCHQMKTDMFIVTAMNTVTEYSIYIGLE